jgi:hypothetical protein
MINTTEKQLTMTHRYNTRFQAAKKPIEAVKSTADKLFFNKDYVAGQPPSVQVFTNPFPAKTLDAAALKKLLACTVPFPNRKSHAAA